ncbi:MAG: ABC transporter ATP-binding protein [Oscillospiraceae bacterium]|nr:ABC transporter ATP-binding protein [Oscillospiraceae bacterium]
MITLENINKIYPVGEGEFYALKDVMLHIEKGDFTAILGPSGSGKSTLLNIIGCLDNPTSGSYRLDDHEITALKDGEKAKLRNQKIGFVLQDFALLNRETVYYNVMLPLLFSSTPYGKIRKKVMAALETVGLSGQEKKLANQLSGGQRQRVAIARALVNDPDLILADEPTGQLDSETGKQIMELLRELNRQGKTVIVVTHDDKVAGYCGRHFRVIDGCVREECKV